MNHPRTTWFLITVALCAAGCANATSSTAAAPAPCPGRIAVMSDLARDGGAAARQYLLERQWVSATPEPVIVVTPDRPKLWNAARVQANLVRKYITTMGQSAVSGTTTLRLLVGTDGRVTHKAVAETSGHEAIDRLVLDAAREMRFDSLVQEGCVLPVMVEVPVVLTVR